MYLDQVCSQGDPASVPPRDHHTNEVKGVGESHLRPMRVSFLLTLTPFSVGITQLSL